MSVELSLPRRYRPFGARMAAGVAAVVLVAAMGFLWLMLPADTRATFGLSERLTLLVVFAGILVALNALFRTSATADEGGLTVTNAYRVHHYDWPELVRISLTANLPWALLDLADGTTVSVLAIQISDGQRAVRATRELATMIAQHSPPEPG
jgi:Bacterial PH domain